MDIYYCPYCGAANVFRKGYVFTCKECGRIYELMLTLIGQVLLLEQAAIIDLIESGTKA